MILQKIYFFYIYCYLNYPNTVSRAFMNHRTVVKTYQRRFYIRGTLRSLRIVRLAKITILYRDWLRSLNSEKG